MEPGTQRLVDGGPQMHGPIEHCDGFTHRRFSLAIVMAYSDVWAACYSDAAFRTIEAVAALRRPFTLSLRHYT